MYQFLSSTQVISRSQVMFFLGAYGSLPNAAIWWCLRTGGGGVLTSLLPLAIDAPVNVKVLEVIYYHRAIQAYWQSHSERCQYYIKKFLEKSYNTGKLNSKFIVFIHGMNSFEMMKRQPSTRCRSISKRAIKELKTAASLSSWNFSNKVRYGQLM